MVKQQKVSRLEETNFSTYNLREAFINTNVEYLAALRDQALFNNYGIQVLIKIPAEDNEDILKENYVDEYSNFTNTNWIETTETVLPLFKEYRQALSDNGMQADGTDSNLALEVIIPTKLHLPRNSRIVFNEYDNKEFKIAREWMVLGTIQKQLSDTKTYSRIAHCVPARQGTTENVETKEHTIWFDNECGYLEHVETLRAQLTIWFLRNCIDNSKLKKVLSDEIQEQIPDYPQYNEQISGLVYYDTRPLHILNSGKGFKVGDKFPVIKDGKQVEIFINEAGEKLPLEIEVTGVSNVDGSLKSFILNTEKGYTEFDNDTLVVQFGNIEQFKANVEIKSIPWTIDTLQETLSANEVLNPKYLNPYEIDTVFKAKRIAINVFN